MANRSADSQSATIRQTTVSANGQTFELLTCGDGDNLCLLLHGFPENAFSWREQMPVLAELGYRVWAPNQRGYGLSSKPRRVRDYDLIHLMADVAALIDLSGACRTILIGHDWGAAVAWTFASRRIRPIDALVILNVPHPVCFHRSLRRPSQMLRSWYALFFQIPWLPEFLLSRRSGRLIPRAILRTSSSPDSFPRELLESFRVQAADRRNLRSMIHWYRAAFRGGLRRQLRIGFPPILTRTLMLWGEADTALARFTTDGTEEFVPDLNLRYLPGISHWLQQDATEEVNQALIAFLSEQ